MSKGMDAVELRKVRMKQVLGMIKALGEKTEYNKVLGVCCFNLGISEQKIREYLRILNDANQIIISKGFIRFPEQKEPESIEQEEQAIDKTLDELTEQE